MPIYSVGWEDGAHGHRIQLVDGPSPDSLIFNSPPDPDQTTRWLVQVADAIDRARSFDVIHRDVKPSNLIAESCEPPVDDADVPSADGSVGDEVHLRRANSLERTALINALVV